MRGACRRCLALVALLALIHTSGSQPVHSICEAGPSQGPAGAQIGRSLLQHQHGSDRLARLDLKAPADGQPSVGANQDRRVVVEEEEEEVGSDAAGREGTESHAAERSMTHAANSAERPERRKVGSSTAQGAGKLQPAGRQVAEEATGAERLEERKGRLSMVNVDFNMTRQHIDHVLNSLVKNMSRWCQEVPSLVSRTWTSVYAKRTRSGPDAMIAVLAMVAIGALVCGCFVAYSRGDRAPSHVARRDGRLATRFRVGPGQNSGNRGNSNCSPQQSSASGGRSNSPSPSGGKSMPVSWSRSMRTSYGGGSTSGGDF